jgi:hypothetical protein
MGILVEQGREKLEHMNVEDYAGHVYLEEGILRFSSMAEKWELEVANIEAIIEYTTEEGPYMCDYFLVMIDRNCYEYRLPTEAKCFSEVLQRLEVRLGFKLRMSLTFSTNFRSRVLFPEDLFGQEGYVLKKMPRNLIRSFFCFRDNAELVLAKPVTDLCHSKI